MCIRDRGDHQRPEAVDPVHPAVAHLPQRAVGRGAGVAAGDHQHHLRPIATDGRLHPAIPRGGGVAATVRATDAAVSYTHLTLPTGDLG